MIDTRNEYEVEIGTFAGAVNPHTNSFREFRVGRDPFRSDENRKVAMFCTGGIRVKSDFVLVEKGFEEVWHLKGGVLKYFEDMQSQRPAGKGNVLYSTVGCRSIIDEKGRFEQCACRFPIDEDQMASEHYVPGVSCPRCVDRHTHDQREHSASDSVGSAIEGTRRVAFGADASTGMKSNQRSRLDSTSVIGVNWVLPEADLMTQYLRRPVAGLASQ